MESSNIVERKVLVDNLYKKLPVTLQTITEPFSGRERDVVLLSSIGVLSNCIPNVSGFYGNGMVYSHLFVIIIAPPASGKGVMNNSRLLIDRIHKRVVEGSKEEQRKCENAKKENRDRKSNYEPCPDMAIKILPANISISEMYSFLDRSKHGLLIMESEADTMNNMLKNDWGNYSDVLRKVFQHEPISMSRKMEKIFIEIDKPKLAMVMSGTPDQLQPLIKSQENGLFSRLMIYSFDEVSDFNDVFAPKSRGIQDIFQSTGDKIFDMYGKLANLEKQIEFRFDENQQRRFLERFSDIKTDIIENHSQAFLSNMHRHGLIMFRVSMILTVLRNIDNLENQTELVCSNRDYVCALYITLRCLRHSLYTFNTIDNNFLSILDREILDDLPNEFTRKEAIEIAEKYNMPMRTLDDKLVQWQKKKFIKVIKRGVYKKL
ncbi:MAG: DUF3987 domain-containing protein [Crocinitomicaceae bacterium]|nr:DUF3987 domain-containing protein [Crocinitomicaceae bacterium]